MEDWICLNHVREYSKSVQVLEPRFYCPPLPLALFLFRIFNKSFCLFMIGLLLQDTLTPEFKSILKRNISSNIFKKISGKMYKTNNS